MLRGGGAPFIGPGEGHGAAVTAEIYTTLTWFNGGVEGLSKQGLRWVIGGGKEVVQDGSARWQLLGGGGAAVVARGRGRP
jgi:hypothetical protein